MWITKVKGHATQEMVDGGKVEQEDMRGNSIADRAADLGAIECQAKVHKFGEMFCWRQKHYRMLMTRVQRFIVGLKTHDKTSGKKKKRMGIRSAPRMPIT